jgi:hypothetical protein
MAERSGEAGTMQEKIIELFHQRFSLCYIAAWAGLAEREVRETLAAVGSLSHDRARRRQGATPRRPSLDRLFRNRRPDAP